MSPLRIFISSVQREFAKERAALRDYVRNDALMRRFFEVFLFEDVPASDRRPDRLYLDEVDRCEIYIGLFGAEYGAEDGEGVSPTEREFDRATNMGKHRLVFVKGTDDARHPKMRRLVRRVQSDLIRKRFATTAELRAGVYSALVEYLAGENLIRGDPFDAAHCAKATLEDLDTESMAQFTRTARQARGFALPEGTPSRQFLEHLNLLNDGRPTNAAMLLFGTSPQRFLRSSEVRCAHYHGVQVAKPIRSYQVYKGTAFELIDQAVDFVLSKINRSIGTRTKNARASRTYEIPAEVVTESIVNAVAHRNYASDGSVQVMLFSDRLEVRNPGRLPTSLTLERLREAHSSVPGNPLLAECLYLADYIERMGTGTLDMIRRCVEVGLPEPEFDVTDGFVATIRRSTLVEGTTDRGVSVVQVRDQARDQARVQAGDQARVQAGDQARVQVRDQARDQARVQARDDAPSQQAEVALPQRARAMLRASLICAVPAGTLMKAAGYSKRTRHFRETLDRLLRDELLGRTVPDKPRSPVQKYRLTEKGRAAIAANAGGTTESDT